MLSLLLSIIWMFASDFPPPTNEIILVEVKNRVGFGIIYTPEMQEIVAERFGGDPTAPLHVNFPFQDHKSYHLVHLESWAHFGLPETVLKGD